MSSSPELEEHELNVVDLALEDGGQKTPQKIPQGDSVIYDDPFGHEEQGEIKYRTMSWW